MSLLVRILINAAALWTAVHVVPGIHLWGGVGNLLVVALIFGVLNAVVRPLLIFFSLPLVIVTLGLFTLVLNGVVLWLTSRFSERLGLHFRVDSFRAAFWGALVISVVSILLSLFVRSERKTDEN